MATVINELGRHTGQTVTIHWVVRDESPGQIAFLVMQTLPGTSRSSS